MATVEIIDFTRPIASTKNLYVSNIKTDELDDAQITNALYEAFSPFDLLHEVLVFPVKNKAFRSSTKQTSPESAYYAFVKFYSYHAAQKARRTLNNTLKLGTGYCKVSNATRCKELKEGLVLLVAQCQRLANHYLGFNGWTSSIRQLEQDPPSLDQGGGTGDDGGGPRVRFFCVVDLNFPRQGLSTHGIGAWEQTYSLHDTSGKASATHIARKRSYHRAVENAFSKVLLVLVRGGRHDPDLDPGSHDKVKVTVEIDTTKVDELTENMQSRLAEEQVLMVNELTEDVCDNDSDDDDDNDDDNRGGDNRKPTYDLDLDGVDLGQDVDDVNLHLLQQLGDNG